MRPRNVAGAVVLGAAFAVSALGQGRVLADAASEPFTLLVVVLVALAVVLVDDEE